MKKFLLAGVAALALIPAAQAADLSTRRAEIPAAVAAPIMPWTGFYLGANAGAAFGQHRINAFSVNRTGFVGGLQVGYDWQFGAGVFGVVGDVSFLDMRQNAFGVQLRHSYEATLRARAGFLATPDLLMYVHGGVGFGDVGANVLGTRTQFLFTVGAGAEYRFTPNLSGMLEYRYVDHQAASFGLFRVDHNNHQVRVGVNYRFSTGGGGLLSARY